MVKDNLYKSGFNRCEAVKDGSVTMGHVEQKTVTVTGQNKKITVDYGKTHFLKSFKIEIK